MPKTNVHEIKSAKGQKKLVMITAYDALFARLLHESADILLVGDSLANSFGGHADTLSVGLDEMIYHTKAVCRGAPEAFVVTDMPFGSYPDEQTALQNAIRVYRETAASAVKIEGGAQKAAIVRHLSDNAVAVMGHIGLMPQFVRAEGGWRIKGKDGLNIQKLIEDAQAIEAAGAFALVIEGVKAEAAEAITKAVKIPTIGIGAGEKTDGQVLVWSDMLGLFEGFKPKFVRRYLEGAALVREKAAAFAADVQSGAFPGKDEQY
ncbi:MAG: 3-methyl-2-oxobutanoate hydroxymethyltransferase [Campylobacterales bacterium]